MKIRLQFIEKIRGWLDGHSEKNVIELCGLSFVIKSCNINANSSYPLCYLYYH